MNTFNSEKEYSAYLETLTKAELRIESQRIHNRLMARVQEEREINVERRSQGLPPVDFWPLKVEEQEEQDAEFLQQDEEEE